MVTVPPAVLLIKNSDVALDKTEPAMIRKLIKGRAFGNTDQIISHVHSETVLALERGCQAL